MSATPEPLKRLLDERRDLWRGRRPPPPAVMSTGSDHLDRQLPTGGWPCGRITELVPERPGQGELQLLLPVLAARTRDQWPVVLVAPPLVPCPQALAGAGVNLARLIIVHCSERALWASEQCLKSGLCGVVAAWPPAGRIRPHAIRRLQLAAENGPAPVFVCYSRDRQPPPSLAALRLAVHPGGELEVLRASITNPGSRNGFGG